ncbi:MAG: hypothetical protein ACE5I5_08795 [Candidatus Heimdallarchaeota archaeon]
MPTKEEMTIKHAQQQVKKFLERKGSEWSQLDNWFFLVIHLITKVGELAREIITAGFDPNLNGIKEKHTPKKQVLTNIAAELGDLFYHILKLDISFEIDLASAFNQRLAEIIKRFG